MNADRATGVLAVVGLIATVAFLLYVNPVSLQNDTPEQITEEPVAELPVNPPRPPSSGISSITVTSHSEKTGITTTKLAKIDPKTWSELQHAINNHDNQKIDALIVSGANIEATTNNGSTAIFVAIAADNPDALKKLLAAGANVEHENRFGVRPIHFSILRNKFESLKKLIEAGADINVPDSMRQRSPLIMAIDNRNKAMTALLLEYGATGDNPLLRATQACDVELVQMLLESDQRFDTTSRQAAIRAAGTNCKAGNKSQIQELLLKE